MVTETVKFIMGGALLLKIIEYFVESYRNRCCSSPFSKLLFRNPVE